MKLGFYHLVGLYVAALFADPSTKYTQMVTQSMNALNMMTPYCFFQPYLNRLTYADLTPIDIQSNSTFTNSNNVANILTNLPSFIQGIGSNSETLANNLTQVIYDTTLAIISGAKTSTAYVRIDSFLPTSAHDTAFWHVDDFAYLSGDVKEYKYVLTFQGNGLLFQNLNWYANSGSWRYHLDDTDFLNDGRLNKAPQTTPSQTGAMFIIGTPQIAAIYSEPPYNTTRFVVTIIPTNFDTPPSSS